MPTTVAPNPSASAIFFIHMFDEHTKYRPLSTGAAFPQDQVASCNVVLADVGALSAKLFDVCSYPSQQPNSIHQTV